MSAYELVAPIAPVYDFLAAASPVLVAWLAWDRIRAFVSRFKPWNPGGKA